MLKPLKQWICDRCGEIIQKPEDGWVEWIRNEDRRIKQIKIVHSVQSSPGGPQKSCLFHLKAKGEQDAGLISFIGYEGITRMLSFIDPGPFISKVYGGPEVLDFREYVEIFRRLHTPFYEEARLYFDEASAAGIIDGHNEFALYDEALLRDIAERFGGKHQSE